MGFRIHGKYNLEISYRHPDHATPVEVVRDDRWHDSPHGEVPARQRGLDLLPAL